MSRRPSRQPRPLTAVEPETPRRERRTRQPRRSGGREEAERRPTVGTTTRTTTTPTHSTPNGEPDRSAAAAGNRRRRRSGQRRGPARTPPAAALPAQLQDPGSHPPPADPAGAGRQGRARHQGRGADHLSVARRPLRRADAQLAARRRHFPQDHLGRRSPPAEGGHGRTRYPPRHGHDRAHRRRQPAEAGDQARLRIPAAAVGRHPRAHDEIGGAGADLRRSQPDQAGDPRRLFARHRRDPGRRRGRLARGARLHAHADAVARQEGAALARRRPAAVRPQPGRGAARRACCCRRCSFAPAATW